MFDALEHSWKHTDQANLITQLYQGKIKDYVKCLQVSLLSLMTISGLGMRRLVSADYRPFCRSSESANCYAGIGRLLITVYYDGIGY